MEREGVTLTSDDTMLQRAEKIWWLLGFANDRGNMVPALAAYMGEYRTLDDRAAAIARDASTPPASPEAQ